MKLWAACCLGSSFLNTGGKSLGCNKTRDCSFTWGISRKLIRADLSFSRDPAWRCFRLVLLSVLMVRSLPRELNLTRQLDRIQSTSKLFWHFSLFLITYMCSENSPLLVLEQLIPREVSWQLWTRGVGLGLELCREPQESGNNGQWGDSLCGL